MSRLTDYGRHICKQENACLPDAAVDVVYVTANTTCLSPRIRLYETSEEGKKINQVFPAVDRTCTKQNPP